MFSLEFCNFAHINVFYAQNRNKQMATKQTHAFQTEVSQLLHLMIHSLYSNKEIFLRELVSNASDAVDKLKFESLSNDALVEGKEELQIHVQVNKDAGTITISDNGIGMTQDEVMEKYRHHC